MRALDASGLSPELLELEITERLILDNSIETADILRKLDRSGIRLTVDDFGTGYSALSYLKSYPFDTLKIDKSFIQDVLTENDDASLRSEEHTSELQSRPHLVCRLLLEK